MNDAKFLMEAGEFSLSLYLRNVMAIGHIRDCKSEMDAAQEGNAMLIFSSLIDEATIANENGFATLHQLFRMERLNVVRSILKTAALNESDNAVAALERAGAEMQLVTAWYEFGLGISKNFIVLSALYESLNRLIERPDPSQVERVTAYAKTAFLIAAGIVVRTIVPDPFEEFENAEHRVRETTKKLNESLLKISIDRYAEYQARNKTFSELCQNIRMLRQASHLLQPKTDGTALQ